MTKDDFTRLNNDVNGNPRYAFHFLHLVNDKDEARARQNMAYNTGSVSTLYQIAINKAHKIGGRKYHNKQYGGGIVIQSYNLYDDIKRIEELKNN